MKNIRCQNCGQQVLFSKKLRCPHCNIKLYGYNINSIPQEYKEIIDGNFPGIQLNPEVSISPKKNSIEEKSRLSTSSNNIKKDKKKLPSHPGWLIVHTEGKEPLDFPLIEGINYIGRPVPDIKPHIEVSDDPFVSRGHAVLCISKNPMGRFEYILTDDTNNQRKKYSLNGTHINGDPERLAPEVQAKLKDGDTLQIGETKLVLKTDDAADTVDEAKTQVQKMNYEKTIIKK